MAGIDTVQIRTAFALLPVPDATKKKLLCWVAHVERVEKRSRHMQKLVEAANAQIAQNSAELKDAIAKLEHARSIYRRCGIALGVALLHHAVALIWWLL